MRGLIRFSSALFIVIGMMAFGVVLLLALAMLGSTTDTEYGGSPFAGLVLLAPAALIAAALIMYGGTTYLLASVDERLERMASMLTGPRPQAPAAVAPVDPAPEPPSGEPAPFAPGKVTFG